MKKLYVIITTPSAQLMIPSQKVKHRELFTHPICVYARKNYDRLVIFGEFDLDRPSQPLSLST
jgi:hypothetical protein